MKQKEFNIRLIVDEKNELHLGFVYGFYKKGKEDGKDVIMQQDVPESVRKKLARRLGILNY